MNATWISLFTFAGTTLFVGGLMSVVYEAYFGYSAALRQRVDEAAGRRKGEKHAALLDLRQLVESTKSSSNWQIWASDMLVQSGLQIELRTLAALAGTLGAALGVFAPLVTQRLWMAPLGLAVGLALPVAYVAIRQRRRIRRLTRQLPDALDAMSRAVRAGQTVSSAFMMVADDFPQPIAGEFQQCYEQQNLGISSDVALRNLARRVGIMELRILVVALLVQSRSGGNLVDLLGNLSTMVRKRLVLEQKVKALTAEGRLQAVVLIALPFVVFIAMFVLNRDYAQILLDRPWLLGSCLCSQAIGAAFIYRLIQIDY